MKQARFIRPRATRAFVTRRRTVLLSAFLVAVAAPMGGYLTAGKDSAAAAAAVITEVLRDPLAVLSGRSPGLREAGAMFQTKPGRERVASTERVVPSDRAPVGPGGPVERVLPVVRERPPGLVPDIGPLAFAPQGVPFGALPPEGGQGVVPSFSSLPPETGSSGGGGSSSGGIVPPNPPPTPGPVPEPATWMMMILGFGLVGSAIRRQSAMRRAAARG